MTRPEPGDAWAPEPETLAAYADGELEGGLRRQVEGWLVEHPDAAAEIEDHRQLARWWQTMPPPQPTDAQWASVLARVETALARRGRTVSEPVLPDRVSWHPLFGLAVAVSGLAAAAVLALVALRTPAPEERLPPVNNFEPFAVVAPEDVEIVSLRAADRVTLVVGVPPVHGPLEFVAPGDVESVSVKPDMDGMVPHVSGEGEPMTPMIVAPIEPGPSTVP